VSNWTQPICDDCWDVRNPTRTSVRINGGYRETCAFCGVTTTSGIYVRVDPTTVPHPTMETDT
jgi:hypothetical protein